MTEVKTADDCLRLIHKGLGQWITCALEAGFEDSPVSHKDQNAGEAYDLIKMARLMAEIEKIIKVGK
jgi:hypothetical protein